MGEKLGVKRAVGVYFSHTSQVEIAVYEGGMIESAKSTEVAKKMDSDTFGILMEESEEEIERLEKLTDRFEAQMKRNPDPITIENGEYQVGTDRVSFYIFDCLIRLLRKQHGLIVKLENELNSKK